MECQHHVLAGHLHYELQKCVCMWTLMHVELAPTGASINLTRHYSLPDAHDSLTL